MQVRCRCIGPQWPSHKQQILADSGSKSLRIAYSGGIFGSRQCAALTLALACPGLASPSDTVAAAFSQFNPVKAGGKDASCVTIRPTLCRCVKRTLRARVRTQQTKRVRRTLANTLTHHDMRRTLLGLLTCAACASIWGKKGEKRKWDETLPHAQIIYVWPAAVARGRRWEGLWCSLSEGKAYTRVTV